MSLPESCAFCSKNCKMSAAWGELQSPFQRLKKTLSFRSRKIFLSRYLTILETMDLHDTVIFSNRLVASVTQPMFCVRLKVQETGRCIYLEICVTFSKKDYQPIHGEIKEKKREAQSTNFRFSPARRAVILHPNSVPRTTCPF